MSKVVKLADAVAAPKCEDEDKDMCEGYKKEHLCWSPTVQTRCPVTCDECDKKRDQAVGTYPNIRIPPPHCIHQTTLGAAS